MGETVILISAEEQRALRWLRQAKKSSTAAKKPEGIMAKIYGFLAAAFRLVSDQFGGCDWYRTSEAIACYRKAGYLFKIIKQWDQAGSAFTQAAMLCLKDTRKYEASSNFVEASKCYRKTDMRRAIDSLEQAVELQEECGGFMISVAAKYHVTLAGLYQSHLHDTEQSMRHYIRAVKCYLRDGDIKARGYMEKVVHYLVEKKEYTAAAQVLELLAKWSAGNGSKYSAGLEFLQAGLCHLCVDAVNAHCAVARYKEIFPPFGSSEECQLMEKLMESVEDANADGFAKAVGEHRTVWTVRYGIGRNLLECAQKQCGEIDLT